MPRPQPARWLIVAAFAAVYLIWGSTYLGLRFALESIPPFRWKLNHARHYT
jgi:hypothetical protein